MAQKKILIVDDEEQVRELIIKSLKDENYSIVEAENGSNVLKLLDDFIPDLILLDLRMPVIDGFMVLRNIQKFIINKGKTAPKILIISAFIDKTSLFKLEDLPVTDCLAKPFKVTDLRKTVAKLLKSK